MSAPLPPPDVGEWRPPPPERRGPEPRTLALVLGGILALVAVVLGVVAVTSGDDGGSERTTDDGGREQAADTADDDRPSRTTDGDDSGSTDDASDASDTTDDASSDTTDGSSDTTDDDTTTDDDGDDDGDDEGDDDAAATTRALPTTTALPSGRPPAPPSSVAPPAITTIAQGTYPPDAAALRATLDAYAFPVWWPLPDTYPAPGDPNPSVQALGVRDTLITFGGGEAAEGTTDWNTSWLDANGDIDAAEARWTGQLPADRFDLATGIGDRTSTTQGDETSYSYVFEGIGAETGYLTVDLSSGSSEAGGGPGTTVDIYYSGPFVTDPAPIPVGAGTGKQFLALAPASSQLRWESTSFTLDTYAGIPSATYSADFTTTAADVDAVLADLSDPATFTGGLRQVAPGTDDDGYWTQDMAYGDLAGRYSLVKPRPGDSGEVYVTLSFALA